MTETELLDAIINRKNGLAPVFGWMVAHFRPAMDRRGRWKTAVSGDGVGFPDLVLVRERVIVVELKSDTGRLTKEQGAWITAFHFAGIEAHVWRPRHLLEVIPEVLRRKPL